LENQNFQLDEKNDLKIIHLFQLCSINYGHQYIMHKIHDYIIESIMYSLVHIMYYLQLKSMNLYYHHLRKMERFCKVQYNGLHRDLFRMEFGILPHKGDINESLFE
jgi:hypothetical protein